MMYRVNTIRLIALALLSLPSVGRASDLDVEKDLLKDNRLAVYVKGGDDDDDGGGQGRGRGRGRGGDDDPEDDNSGPGDGGDDDSGDDSNDDDSSGGDDDTSGGSTDENGADAGENTNADTDDGALAEARAQIDRIIIDTPGITIFYKNGWVEFLDPDIYELRDYKNRRVIRRKATQNDVWRFDQLLGP